MMPVVADLWGSIFETPQRPAASHSAGKTNEFAECLKNKRETVTRSARDGSNRKVQPDYNRNKDVRNKEFSDKSEVRNGKKPEQEDEQTVVDEKTPEYEHIHPEMLHFQLNLPETTSLLPQQPIIGDVTTTDPLADPIADPLQNKMVNWVTGEQATAGASPETGMTAAIEAKTVNAAPDIDSRFGVRGGKMDFSGKLPQQRDALEQETATTTVSEEPLPEVTQAKSSVEMPRENKNAGKPPEEPGKQIIPVHHAVESAKPMTALLPGQHSLQTESGVSNLASQVTQAVSSELSKGMHHGTTGGHTGKFDGAAAEHFTLTSPDTTGNQVVPQAVNTAFHDLAPARGGIKTEMLQVSRTEVVQRLAEVMTDFMRSGSTDEKKIELSISPPNLGTVSVSLRMERGVLYSDFSCAPENLSVIKDNIAQLRQSLADNGVMLGGAGVNVGDQHTSWNSGSQAGYDSPDRGRPELRPETPQLRTTPVASSTLDPSQHNYLI